MQKYIVKVHNNGDRFWKNENGDLHREDGPAVERPNGYKAWYQNGELHRDDGPALEHPDGYRAWYQNDVRHREDGPALKNSYGYKEWWIHGVQYTEEEFNLQINSCHDKIVEIDGKKYQLKEI